MRIVSNKKCYINGADAENILYNHDDMPISVKEKLNNYLIRNGNNDYFLINDKSTLNYILSLNMIDYCDYMIMDDSLIGKLINELKYEIGLSLDGYTFESDESAEKRIRNNEYIISQLIEILKLRNHNSKIAYPMIENPFTSGVTSGSLRANYTIDMENVIIRDMNGNKINEIDMPFCETAYRLLMHDMIENVDDIKLDFMVDAKNNIVVVNGRNTKSKLLKMNMPRY